MDLAKSGILDYDIPLRLIIEGGTNTADFISLSTSFKKLTFLKNILSTTVAYEDFEVKQRLDMGFY